MRNKYLALVTSAVLVVANPVAAQAATLRIVGIVPVSCAADLVGGSISGKRLTVSVRRSCNTWHSIVVRGDHVDGLGDVSFSYNGKPTISAGDDAIIDQPERFYDGVDQLTIEVTEGTSEDFLRYASSLRIELETT
jgi:hypothetical protein